MRRSSEVPLTLLAAVALTAIGCHDQPRHCVDGQSRLQPDAACQVTSGGGFHYVYGGSSGGHVGDFVLGASASRGGFGGGGGEGGGEGGE